MERNCDVWTQQVRSVSGTTIRASAGNWLLCRRIERSFMDEMYAVTQEKHTQNAKRVPLARMRHQQTGQSRKWRRREKQSCASVHVSHKIHSHRSLTQSFIMGLRELWRLRRCMLQDIRHEAQVVWTLWHFLCLIAGSRHVGIWT